MDADKAELYRAQVIGSTTQPPAAHDSSASLTRPSCPAGTSPAPQDESPKALPDQAMPGASARYGLPEQAVPSGTALDSESAVSDTPVVSHGKKRKADTECARPAAHAEAVLKCRDGAGTQTASASNMEGVSFEPDQARCQKGSSKQGRQGTLPAAFAKAKVHD